MDIRSFTRSIRQDELVSETSGQESLTWYESHCRQQLTSNTQIPMTATATATARSQYNKVMKRTRKQLPADGKSYARGQQLLSCGVWSMSGEC